MKTKYLLPLLLFLLFNVIGGAAQNIKTDKPKRTVILLQNIKDSFTGVKLKAHVTLMSQDSTIIDTTICQGWQGNYIARFEVEAKPARYIVKAECEGYATNCIDYEIKRVARNKAFKMPDLNLRKLADSDIFKEVDLDGVVVTGTKVKFTYRGDTLVYNASAFNVPDGSMLDALVRQLPGAEIKSNGDIYVNGKKIDYLTLNGKDFFKGNNKIMLDNLPHYTVQDLKVYNKSTEKSRLAGTEVEKKDYVMDVELKREYNRGYIANAEAAGGTRDRYMARLFGLYYDDYTRFSVFSNVNNVNENRRPGREGDWSPSNSPQGQVVTKQVGTSLSTQNKAGSLREQFDATASWNDFTDITRTSSEQFASAGNIFNRTNSTSVQKEFRLNANNQISYTDESSFYLMSSTSFNYGDGTNNSSTERATFDSEDNMAAGSATNRSHTIGLTKFRTTSINENLLFGFKFPWGDMIGFNLNGSYASNKPQDCFSLTDNEYLRENKNDLRRVYADSHNNTYNYGTEIIYSIQLNNWRIVLNQKYSQNFTSTNQLNYRLERLGGLYNRFDQQQLDRLPTTRDSLLLALDTQNSKTYRLLTRQYNGEPALTYNHNNTYFSLKLPYRLVRERINYNCASVDTTAVRSKWLVEPSLYFNKWNDKFDVNASYSLSSIQPSMESLMPIDNDINPLARSINNPNLKTSVTHNISGYAGFNFKNKSRLSVGFNSSLYMDMIGTRTIYNTKTGAYTYMNDNVHSGNWTLNTNADYTGKLDKKGLFAIETRLSLDYTKSTDFDIAYDVDINNAASTLSRVYTSILRDYLKLSFQKGELSLALVADAQWRNSTSNRDNFQTLNAYDYNYGMTLSYKLPLGIQLATDLKQYSRRGYGDSSMNTDDLVWNASLARSFCNGRLTLTAEGFDLLHQLSNTTYTVNAQGRTEVWRNTIPNYVMMHVAYKWSKMPKKRGK